MPEPGQTLSLGHTAILHSQLRFGEPAGAMLGTARSVSAGSQNSISRWRAIQTRP